MTWKIVAVLAAMATVNAYEEECPRGSHWDMEFCQCLADFTCARFRKCEPGMMVDPRYKCVCTEIPEVKALVNHGLDENCEPIQKQTCNLT